MIFFWQITNGELPDPQHWRAWTNAKGDTDLLVRMSVNKFLRERGGLQRGENLPISIFWHTNEVPHPRQCTRTQFVIRRDDCESRVPRIQSGT